MDTGIVERILLIGDQCTGKSFMFSQYTTGEIQPDIYSTIGVGFATKSITIGDKTKKLLIWDTPGNERYQSIALAHYGKAQGMILVFDITKQTSFYNLPKFITLAKQFADPNLKLILVGNKKDLADKRMVSVEAAQGLAKEHGIEYMEISSLNHEDCENVFISLSKQIEATKAV